MPRRSLVYALSAAGGAFLTAGGIIATFAPAEWIPPGLFAAAAGLVTTLAAVHYGRKVEPLEVVAEHMLDEGEEDETKAAPTGLMAALGAALTASLLFGVSTFVFLAMAGYQGARDPVLLGRVATGLVAIMGPLFTATHIAAVRAAATRQLVGGGRAIANVMMLVTLILGLGIASLYYSPVHIGLPLPVQEAHGPLLLLTATILMGFTLVMAHHVPNVYTVLTSQRAVRMRAAGVGKGIPLPIILGFTLLFVLIPLVLLTGGFEKAQVLGLSVRALIGLLILIAFGVLVAATVMVTLVTFRAEARLFKIRPRKESVTARSILMVSVILALISFSLAAILAAGVDVRGLERGRWVDFAAVGILVMLGPYGFYRSWQDRRIRSLEERFPDLLRDIASARKAGLTMQAAVAQAAHGDYGALNPEIRRMAAQLEWNVPFSEVLNQFADRVRTPLVNRAVALIEEATHLGGSVSDVIMAAAREAREIKNLETERRISMLMYTAIIYVAFFVFLAVVVVLYASLIPALVEAGAGVAGSSVGGAAAIVQGAVTLEQYRQFYFIAAVVQAIGNGVVAGIMMTGNARSALPHTFVMLLLSVVIFSVALG